MPNVRRQIRGGRTSGALNAGTARRLGQGGTSTRGKKATSGSRGR